jgi:hypothetical protein
LSAPRHRAPADAARPSTAGRVRQALRNGRPAVFWFVSAMCAVLLVAAPVAIFFANVPTGGSDGGAADADRGGAAETDPPVRPTGPTSGPTAGATLSTEATRAVSREDDGASPHGGADGSTNAVVGGSAASGDRSTGGSTSGGSTSGGGSDGGSSPGGGGGGTPAGQPTSGGSSSGGGSAPEPEPQPEPQPEPDPCPCEDPVGTVTDTVDDVVGTTRETAEQVTEPVGGLGLP